MTYLNTNREAGPALAESRRRARSQEERILAYLKKCAAKADGRARAGSGTERYTPEEIRSLVFSGSVPLTSVRRALTNLTDSGELVKTDTMRPGLYGKHVHTWRLADAKPKQAEMFGGGD